jgi:hypothetical protein
MESVTEQLESPAISLPRAAVPEQSRVRRAAVAARPFQVAILFYLGTRGLLLLVALINGSTRHHAFLHELANWDGLWYRWLANHGYPAHVLHARSTLGFFPLYPIVIRAAAYPIFWSTGHSMLWSITVAGVLVSSIGGLVATVLVQRLATGWWGEASGLRAGLLFCAFPGSVVFSMVYAEGVLLPLAVGCILALERRRWLLAGVLAGLATAAEPEALVLVPVCAVSAFVALRRGGWRLERPSLIAPLLSLTGVGAFAIFLWAWTGTPFASLIAQRYGWGERTDPLALVHLVNGLASEISFAHFNHPTINLNLVIGIAGAVFLIVMLVMLVRAKPAISIEAAVWTAGIGFLAVTSEYTAPNPRLLITAFPAILVLAHYVKGRWFAVVLSANTVLLAGLSALTFIGTTLRP